MSLETKIIQLAQAIGTDVKALNVKVGDISSLPTTAKTDLVVSIVELFGMIGDVENNVVNLIDDTAIAGVVDKTWSADKILEFVQTASSSLKDEILDGAGEALDTLKELADALGNDPNFAATIAAEIANRVRFDQAQTLTAAQKKFACTNIGVGDPEHDFVVDYTTAKGGA